MKKLLLSLSFLFASAIIFAAPRSLSQMKEAAKSVLKAAPAATRGGQAQLEVLKQGVQYTVIGYTSGGFAVITNDDRFNAVIGYSDRQFSTETLPPAMLWWMDAADEALRLRLESGATVRESVTPGSMGYPEAVGQLMATTWDQGTPYNNIIAQQLGGAYPTGCVATAMAQVMKYYNWPDRGTGFKTHRFQFEENGPEYKLTADFENTSYQWDNMLPSYSGVLSYTEEEANAVATLMLHCGVAVEMNYGLSGSGAQSSDAATAMSEYFKYNTKFYMRDIYSGEQEWMGIIYEEISNRRPVLYGGATASGAGHAFVFDGYDANGLVHVNWGWSGSGNDYFDVAILDSKTGAYSYQQDMIVVHHPDAPEIQANSQWGILPTQTWITNTNEKFDTHGYFRLQASGKTLTFNMMNVANCDASPFTGTFALLAAPDGGGTPHELFTQDASNVECYYGIGIPGNEYSNSASIDGLPDGTYRVYLATKATTETDWQPVRSNETIVNNYLLTVSGGTATVTEGEPGWTTGIERVTVTGGNGDGTVRVYTADGVLVYTAPAAGFRLDDVPARGLLIVKRGAETVKVVKK